MSAASQARKTDPVVAEIIRNGFIAATEEMKTNLLRTAYNMIIYEALDFTVGLFDRAGNTISIGIGLPMFIRGMSETVKAKIAFFGYDNMVPGDVLLTNNAYITGSHLNHMTFTVPIFDDGEVIAFAACMAHWQDIGGTLDGVTTDIYSEGLQMPIVKAWRAGVINEDVMAIIRMNVRLPERAMGDLKAQVAAIRTGERRFLELVRKYGCQSVLDAIELVFDHSAQVARDAVRSIPDGTYEAESFMDDDGIVLGRHVPIHVKVTVHGDHMTIDLTDVSEEVQGFYNSGAAAGRSCAQVAFKCLTSPLDLPINDGAFRALDVILPPKRVVSAQKPAPMRWWMTYPMTVVDTIFKALAPAIPQRVVAAHHADLVIGSIHGRQPRDGQLYLYLGGLIGGGWGAKHCEDGMSATIAINDGDTHNGPTEQVEAKYPLLVERYALREDSGGAGRYRGGLGCEQVVRALADIGFNVQVDRVNCLPWGLFGGLSGAGNEVGLVKGGTAVRFATGKVLSQKLAAGDTYRLASGGGGGFGSPLDRPAQDVQHDVRQGYVSFANARDLYGVVLDGQTRKVRASATEKLRAYMREQGLPHDRQAPHTPTGQAVLAQHGYPKDAEARQLELEIQASGLMHNHCC